jgi:hypothetical protein
VVGPRYRGGSPAAGEPLDAAGFEPEPSDTAGEAGDSTGNGCSWEGGQSVPLTASVRFLLSDLESNNLEEVITDQETDVDGRRARRVTGFRDTGNPACGMRIEVEPGVIVEMEVEASDDEPRFDRVCAILDPLVRTVSAQIAGSDG